MKAEAVPFTPVHNQLCGITSRKDPHLHLAQCSLSGSHRYQGRSAKEPSICSPVIKVAPVHILEIFMGLLLGQFLWPKIKS